MERDSHDGDLSAEELADEEPEHAGVKEGRGLTRRSNKIMDGDLLKESLLACQT